MDVANVFVDSDVGELFYYLLVVGLSLAAWLLALEQRTRSDREDEAERYLIALSLVVLVWGALSLSNLATIIIPDIERAIIMPPMERLTTSAIIVLLVWAFLISESQGAERGLGLLVGACWWGCAGCMC